MKVGVNNKQDFHGGDLIRITSWFGGDGNEWRRR